MNNRFFINGALVLGVLLIMAAAGGCATPWETIRKNVENSRQLRVGMTKSEVLAIMGEPLRDESFGGPDLWLYYVEMVWADGLITEDECIPLVFEDGRLAGWGNRFYLDHRLKLKNAEPVHNPDQKQPAGMDLNPGGKVDRR